MIQARRQYWSRTMQIAREVYNSGRFASLDEQAGPAYLEGFALSRWIFRRRLSVLLRSLPMDKGQRCVDFGCGFGLLLPLLKDHFETAVGIDLLPDLARAFLDRWDRDSGKLQSDIRIFASLEEAGLAPGSTDLVLALDVLEHVPDLRSTLKNLHNILAPGGYLAISGPTENWLYRLGRRIVGFSGEYHHCNIYDILAQMQELFSIRSVRRLPAIMPLFLIAVVQKY
jgi:2-polyprenyl-3-methyl-5-hydroxy-6-metoxy-1,4-benzoquinol methylase